MRGFPIAPEGGCSSAVPRGMLGCAHLRPNSDGSAGAFEDDDD